MLELKFKNENFLNADTNFGDLDQTREGNVLNNAIKQFARDNDMQEPDTDQNVQGYFKTMIESGDMTWNDIDQLLNRKEQ
jgi:hypothetical protein